MTRPAGARGATVPAGCPVCGGPRTWQVNRKGRWAQCNACQAAKNRVRVAPSVVEAARALLDFGVPMGGNAGDLVCSYCGEPWERVRETGHQEGCRWIALRDAVVRET